MLSLERKSTRPSSTSRLLVAAVACFAALALPSAALAAPAAPQLSLEPGSYDFGLQPVYQSAQATIQLKNDGAEQAWFESIGVVGPGSSNIWVDSNSCWSASPLQPGESCSLNVNFNPGEPTAYEAQLKVDSGGSSFYAGLSGEGGSPNFVPDANPVEFGVARVGAEGNTREIAVTNEGNWPGGVFIAVISGGAVASYQVLDENCTNRLLYPADSCTVQVRFRPVAEGVKKATLSMFGESDGGTQVILTGTGAAPDPVPAPIPPAASAGAGPGAVTLLVPRADRDRSAIHERKRRQRLQRKQRIRHLRALRRRRNLLRGRHARANVRGRVAIGG